jgi:hypothetical protein
MEIPWAITKGDVSIGAVTIRLRRFEGTIGGALPRKLRSSPVEEFQLRLDLGDDQ